MRSWDLTLWLQELKGRGRGGGRKISTFEEEDDVDSSYRGLQTPKGNVQNYTAIKFLRRSGEKYAIKLQIIQFCLCCYSLCDTLTSSATFHTPEVTKQSWKLRCPVEKHVIRTIT